MGVVGRPIFTGPARQGLWALAQATIGADLARRSGAILMDWLSNLAYARQELSTVSLLSTNAGTTANDHSPI